ncbi:hypothetical protein AAE478_001815 [Parahypoxylon ruwenzoriense]
MPHSIHEANERANGGPTTRADNVSMQAAQMTMLERWANETLREELPITEVIIQQPSAGSPTKN